MALLATLSELEAEAARFVGTLVPSPGRATLVTLSGELGAGKTTFTKAIAKTLGVDEIVNSPTFVLAKIYALPADKNFKRLVHVDAYRLENGSELAPLGFDELMKDAENLVLLEWPERVADALPTPATHIAFEVLPDGSRTVTYG